MTVPDRKSVPEPKPGGLESESEPVPVRRDRGKPSAATLISALLGSALIAMLIAGLSRVAGRSAPEAVLAGCAGFGCGLTLILGVLRFSTGRS